MTVEIESEMENSSPVQSTIRKNGMINSSQVINLVDRIIVLQGVPNLNTSKSTSLADAMGFIEHHKNNMDNKNFKSNGIKFNNINDLPIIPDEDEKLELIKDEQQFQILTESEVKSNADCMKGSRELADLSPISEKSSDVYQDALKADRSEETSTFNIERDANKNYTAYKDLSDSESSLNMGLVVESDGLKQKKKKVNINELSEDLIEMESTALKCDSELSSIDKSTVSNICSEGYLTMSGTIKRGKKKGHNVDVKLNISREELEVLEAAIVAEELNKGQRWSRCAPATGYHILLWTILCMPGVFLASAIYSFYIGTITWYNIFTYFSECRNIWKRVFLSPFVILLYPFFIITLTLGVGFFSAIMQVTCCASSWWKEVCDLEKGFYGWFCSALHLSDCSPYEVVILTDVKVGQNASTARRFSTYI